MDLESVQVALQDPPVDVPAPDSPATEQEPASLKRKLASLGVEDDVQPSNSPRPKLEGPSGDLSVSKSLNVPILPDFKTSPDYFYEDGNIILLVHDTFFRVHRSRLCTDGSIFSTMFSLPQDGDQSQVDGQSMQRPIRFADKPRRFSNLLWALYALPAQLRSINTTAENCMKLIDIATAAQKYCFTSTEEWALSCLVDLVKMSSHLGDRQVNPWKIFALASLCNNNELRTAMIEKIKEKAASGKLQYSWVITIGESLNIPELVGEGYYRTVIKNPEQWDVEGRLNDEMLRKLYVGFCKLVTFKDAFLRSPIAIPNHDCGLNAGQCRARWELVWKEGLDTLALPSVDVLGQLRGLVRHLRHSRTYPGPCHTAWVAALDTKIQDFQSGLNLYNFFKP